MVSCRQTGMVSCRQTGLVSCRQTGLFSCRLTDLVSGRLSGLVSDNTGLLQIDRSRLLQPDGRGLCRLTAARGQLSVRRFMCQRRRRRSENTWNVGNAGRKRTPGWDSGCVHSSLLQAEATSSFQALLAGGLQKDCIRIPAKHTSPFFLGHQWEHRTNWDTERLLNKSGTQAYWYITMLVNTRTT